TPNVALFSQLPSYQRLVATDVNALAVKDLNIDGYGDVVTGLGSSTSNINVWVMQSSGSSKGTLSTIATNTYTASGATGVRDIAFGPGDSDAYTDMVVGTYSSSTTGGFEIWHGASNRTSFTRAARDIYTTLPGTSTAVGAVQSIAVADFNGD